MRELAGEQRDEGDEGAGQRAREKKKIEEERRKEKPEKERERKGNEKNIQSSIILIWGMNKKFSFFLDVCYSAHLSIDVHYSK